jgi:hypothetical protein
MCLTNLIFYSQLRYINDKLVGKVIVRSCIVRSFRVSCVFRIVRVKRLVRFVYFYDPGSVHLFSTHVLFKSVLFTLYTTLQAIS